MPPTPLRLSENLQAPEKPGGGDGSTVEVVDVFPTIQGEGPFGGRPAVFVRLAGCNLRCPGCDTNYTAGRQVTEVSALVALVKESAPLPPSRVRSPLVVVTGGEPFRQTIGPLARALCSAGFVVQVETNGTLYEEDFPWYGNTVIVCSPKTGTVHQKLQPHVLDLKYVLRAGAIDPPDGLPTSILGAVAPARPWPGFRGTVWVQPEDEGDAEKNAANTKAAIASAMKFGYRYTPQLHKILDMP